MADKLCTMPKDAGAQNTNPAALVLQWTGIVLICCFCLAAAGIAAAARLELTAAEQDYLKANAPLVFISQTHYPPFEFRENGERTGMSIELVRWMATELGFAARFSDASFQQAQQAVLDGRAHVLTSLFRSPEREKRFDFSRTIFRVPASIFVRAERTDIKGLEDLNGKRIAMQAGDYAKEFLDSRKIDFKAVYTGNFAQATDLVIAQKADAVVGDEQIVWYHVYKNKLAARVKKVGRPLYTGQNCMAVKEGNTVLAAILDKGIGLAVKTGTLEKINRKWLGTSMSPFYGPVARYLSLIITAMVVVCCLAILVWLWNMRLRKLVARKTAALQRSESQYRSLMENVNVGVYRTTADADGRFIKFNPAFVRIFGYDSADELAGMTVSRLYVDPADRQAFVDRISSRGTVKGMVFEMRKKDGTRFWAACSATGQFDAGGALQWIDGIVEDITERKAYEDHLSYHAFHDPLTGLLNRNALFERLEEGVRKAWRYNRHLAVLFVDLDHFKKVNDSYGHECGDEVLRQVARRFQDTLRESDFVFRFGGDEFVVVLAGARNVEPEPVAAKLVVELSRPYRVDDKIIDFIRPSIGIAIFPGDGQDGKTLLRQADKAMYRAKSAPQRYIFCDSKHCGL